MRRLGVSGALLLCVLVVVSGAAAVETDNVQRFTIETINSPVPETGSATFKISLTNGNDATATVKWSTKPGSALANQDYVPQSATVPVPKGGSVNVSVPLIDDGVDEDDEQFSVELSEPSGEEALGTPSTATTTITDNDLAPSLSIANASADEGAGTISFPVTLSAPSGKRVKVTYASENEIPVSATAGADYTAKTAELTFNPGETSKNAAVAVTNDGIDEDNETFKVRLSAPENATLADATATGTIIDNDGKPTVSVENAPAVTEGGQAVFKVTLAGSSSSPITVKWEAKNRSPVSAAAGSDFVPATGVLLWAPGNSDDKTVTVQTLDDARDEAQETFIVELSEVSANAAIGANPGVGTINDNDDPPVARIANAADVTEGGEATFAVTLDGPSGRNVRVSYQTADQTAVAGADYEGRGPGSEIVFLPGEALTKNITIKTVDDSQTEGDETFGVLLTGSPDGSAAINTGQNQAAARIKDNDSQRTISITGAEVTEGDGGTVNLHFKVRLSGTTSQLVQVVAVTQDGSAQAPADYQARGEPIVWVPNTPAAQLEKTFTVLVNGDALDEPTEAMLVTLVSPLNATIAAGQATGTINDNDNRSLLSVSDATANEGSAGATSTMTFKVTLAPASARGVSVAYGTADGTATAGADYTAKSGSVSFAPGETEKTIDIAVLGDDLNEENETVLLNLSSPGGVALADAQGQGVIVDKNAPPSLSINDVTAREGEGATFTVTLAGTTLRPVTVTFSTGDGTAKEGSDYAPRRGTLTFAPGEKTKTVAVSVLDDTLEELAETFAVSLGDPVNAIILKRSGTATIESSDLSTAANPAGGGLNSGTGGLNNRPLPVTPKLPAGKPTGKTATKVLLPRIILGPRIVTLRSRQARMLVTCIKNSPIVCAGSIEFETAAKPTLKLGKKAFSVKKGKKAFVPITLSAKGMKLLQKTGKLQVKVIVYVKTSAKKSIKVQPGVITVKVAAAASQSSTP